MTQMETCKFLFLGVFRRVSQSTVKQLFYSLKIMPFQIPQKMESHKSKLKLTVNWMFSRSIFLSVRKKHKALITELTVVLFHHGDFK